MAVDVPTTEGGAEAPLSTASYPGIEIEYFTQPKRKYTVNGEEVPSVTTVLECLDKPALPWWGMTVGAENTAALFNMGLIYPVQVLRGGQSFVVMGCHHPDTGQPVVAGKEEIVGLLSKHQLTVNHVKDKAGDRGQSCHDALELFCKDGTIPDVGMFPAEEVGYVQALHDFLVAARPVTVEAEIMVASAKHRFAGRVDWRMQLIKPVTLVVHHTPKKGAQYATIPAGEYIVDLKTSKSVYFSHAKQLAGYEIGFQECGFGPSDGRFVLHCDADGLYRFVRVDEWATPADFLTTLAEFHSQAEMKTRKPKGGAS